MKWSQFSVRLNEPVRKKDETIWNRNTQEQSNPAQIVSNKRACFIVPFKAPAGLPVVPAADRQQWRSKTAEATRRKRSHRSHSPIKQHADSCSKATVIEPRISKVNSNKHFLFLFDSQKISSRKWQFSFQGWHKNKDDLHRLVSLSSQQRENRSIQGSSGPSYLSSSDW